MLKNISITLYNFKYVLYYVHVYSCHQDEQTHCTSILQIFCWKIYSFSVPVYHSTVLCASISPGKPLTRMSYLQYYCTYVHTTRVCKYQQLKHHVHICIYMLPLYKDWSWGICIIQLQAIKFKILTRAWRDHWISIEAVQALANIA